MSYTVHIRLCDDDSVITAIELDVRDIKQGEQTIAILATALKQDCGRNGFHNVPTECENVECNDCGRDDGWRESVGCPYME